MAGDIQLSANFDLRTSKALDGRTVVATPSERNSLPFAYAGISVFVLSNLRRYTLTRLPASNTLNWREEGGLMDETTLPVTTTGQTVFSIPTGTQVHELYINGQKQERGQDWRQGAGTIEWVSTDFQIDLTDNIKILNT